MKNVVVVYLLAELTPGSPDAESLVFSYEDGAYLPKLGEFVYFGDSRIKFQIKAREHFYINDDTLRIVFRLDSPKQVDDATRKALHAPLTQMKNL
ncbi:hypothetical protein [Rheinheimera sp. WS51]|uniref:hypothetical protein n=1 Tax=Rheinheimera sp. WS51 TaxID=3425886 RepID=UPI003D8A822F